MKKIILVLVLTVLSTFNAYGEEDRPLPRITAEGIALVVSALEDSYKTAVAECVAAGKRAGNEGYGNDCSQKARQCRETSKNQIQFEQCFNRKLFSDSSDDLMAYWMAMGITSHQIAVNSKSSACIPTTATVFDLQQLAAPLPKELKELGLESGSPLAGELLTVAYAEKLRGAYPCDKGVASKKGKN